MKSITPGPWTREGGLIVDEAGNVIAGRYARLHKEKGEGYGTISPTEADANCQAMSAVPELLEACEAVLSELRRWRDMKPEQWDALVDVGMCNAWDGIKQAIAKARGEA